MIQDTLLQIILDLGATKAAVIDQSQIVLNDEFRKACEVNSCGVYGKCWMCPPDVGEIHELMARVRAWPKGIWYQTISPLEDSFDFEGMTAAKENHLALSHRIQANLPEGVRTLHLTCGGCGLCERCAKRDDEPCRFPDKALPSVESYGMDVYNTTKSTDLKYINGANTVTYFGLVLFEEA